MQQPARGFAAPFEQESDGWRTERTVKVMIDGIDGTDIRENNVNMLQIVILAHY